MAKNGLKMVERGPHHKVRSTTKWSQRAETSQVEHMCTKTKMFLEIFFDIRFRSEGA